MVLEILCLFSELYILRNLILLVKFTVSNVLVPSVLESFLTLQRMLRTPSILCTVQSRFRDTFGLRKNCHYCKSHNVTNALSFYVTKTVLVGPKWFWSDQIDLDLTIMIWSWTKWIGHDQNELVGSKLVFSTKTIYHRSNLDPTSSFWSWPIHFGCDQIIMVWSKSIWSDQNHFGPTKTVLVT